MPAFSSIIAAAAAGRQVTRDFLVEFRFASSTVRLWSGLGTLTTPDGRQWLGAGQLGAITGLDAPFGAAAPVLRFTLSGVDATIAAKALAGSAEITDGIVQVLMVFFDAFYAVLDTPLVIRTAVMSRLEVEAIGPSQWTVNVEAEGYFARRAHPRNSFLTDRDQQARHPGQYVASMQDQTVIWPP
jgi:hypothetical protein